MKIVKLLPNMMPAVAFRTSLTVSGADIGITKKESIFVFSFDDFTFFIKRVDMNELMKLLGVFVS